MLRSSAFLYSRFLVIFFVCSALCNRALSVGNAVSTPVSTRIIYDNSAGDNPAAYYTSLEYGDEINPIPSPSGQPWILTDFLFEYYGDFTPQGDETARFRIYKNDGPGGNASPGTVLFDSGDFALEAGYQTRAFEGLNITIPLCQTCPASVANDLTWTVQFSGMRNVTGDEAGLLLRPTPTVGHSFKDFWVKNPTGWTLSQILPPNPNLPPDPVTNPDPIENFACRLIGIDSANSSPPTLSIRRQGDSLILEWTGAAHLQSSTFVQGTYTEVTGASSPYTVKINSGALKFWRLQN